MIDTKTVCEIIIKSGGVPIIAHSGKILRKLGATKYESLIKQLIKNGVMGLEIYYPTHTTMETNIMRGITKKYKLYNTCGSDYHGKNHNNLSKIGVKINKKDCEPFFKHIF